MTPEELEAAKAMLARKQVGWAYMAEERKERLRSTVTKDAIPAFQSSFDYARTLPPRQSSGLVEFYRILCRGRKQSDDQLDNVNECETS